jgi:vacuolar-type H+-ATPase subunit C/Vma6
VRSGGSAGEAWRPPLARWAATGDLTALERELERRRIADAGALFANGDPLAIDVPLAFMASKQTEARNLRLLGEASVRGIHPDDVRRELLWPGVRP